MLSTMLPTSGMPRRGGPPVNPPVPGARLPEAPVPRAPVPKAAGTLLKQAHLGLAEASTLDAPARRYAAAHLAALRAAAAVLAARAQPARRGGRPASVWTMLGKVAPELREWAAFFASCSAVRVAAEAGITRLVSPRDADDLTRQVEEFVRLVERGFEV